MDQEEIRHRIDTFPVWHYQFTLGDNLTPIFKESHIQRHIERKRYFFDPIVEVFGGTLTGKRVLDLGCNAGFWSLCALESRADYVLGIDARQMHIDQAEFVFSVKSDDKERYTFVAANLFDADLEAYGQFDIVFCFGLMYHVSKPVELMEKVAAVNSDLLIIDTSVSLAPGSYMEIRHEPTDVPRFSADYELVMYPTKRALLDLVKLFDYSGIILKPQFSTYRALPEYRLGFRRAVVCSRQSDLSKFPARAEPQGPVRRAGEFVLWIVYKTLGKFRALNWVKRVLKKDRGVVSYSDTTDRRHG